VALCGESAGSGVALSIPGVRLRIASGKIRFFSVDDESRPNYDRVTAHDSVPASGAILLSSVRRAAGCLGPAPGSGCQPAGQPSQLWPGGASDGILSSGKRLWEEFSCVRAIGSSGRRSSSLRRASGGIYTFFHFVHWARRLPNLQPGGPALAGGASRPAVRAATHLTPT
jgi:hypothetical protein